jgi:hypothetical protein
VTIDTREARALAVVSPMGGAWRSLGYGKEGVVATDGVRVCKLFDGWSDRADGDIDATLALLRRLFERAAGARFLPLEPTISRIDNCWALFYHYEPTTPFTGGCEDELVAFIQILRSIDLMYYGYRTSSFRVGPRGLQLVDLGVDVLPLQTARWRHNLERAFLMARHGHRADLKALQQRALDGADLRELDGFESFKRACEDAA